MTGAAGLSTQLSITLAVTSLLFETAAIVAVVGAREEKQQRALSVARDRASPGNSRRAR